MPLMHIRLYDLGLVGHQEQVLIETQLMVPLVIFYFLLEKKIKVGMET